VCKLRKSIYGLKQEAREWNKKLNDTLLRNDFTRSQIDPCLYSKQVNDLWVYILIFVDDLITASLEDSSLDDLEHYLKSAFQVKNLGDLKYYLGIHFERDESGIFFLHQRTYIERKLKEFHLEDSKPSNIPLDPGYVKRTGPENALKSNQVYRSAIGSLLYLATNTRPDIAVSTSILARKVSQPCQSDWTEVKRVYRYLKETINKRLRLGDSCDQEPTQLIGYADANWGGDRSDRKSNTGYFLTWNGGTISWASRKQDCVALSSTESEYIAVAEATQDAIWTERLLSDLHEPTKEATLIYEDNQSCIKLIDTEKIGQ